MLFTLVFYGLIIITVLIFAMWMSPSFKDMVVNGWGAVGAALAAILAWVLSWFAGTPPELPM